ncbi:hypothetical protein FH972_026719 [Carpinus fangiana]|uniref:C2H2-type domain-containing protein n=1 Tax=Carpinus fangiana TaxID=176857 RepID=A0A5N6L4U0_9ROSI|nr:hypothetical protein FH972_026719 [Carpinus fangiana]
MTDDADPASSPDSPGNAALGHSSDGDVKMANDAHAAANPRKRKRPRRDPDQKHVCTAPGCGKAYSRAEHLYRHQLNHQPKEIFHCKWPDCQRTFVRQDLCLRHEERHSTHPADNVPSKSNFRNPPHVAALVSSVESPMLHHRTSFGSANGSATNAPDGPQPSATPGSQTEALRSPSIPRGQGFGMPPPTRASMHNRANSMNSSYSDGQQTVTVQQASPFQQQPSQTVGQNGHGDTASLPSPAWSDTSTRNDHVQFVPQQSSFAPQHNSSMLDGQAPAGLQTHFTPAPSMGIEIDRWLYPDDTTAWLFGNENNFDQNDFMQSGLFTTFDGVMLNDIPDLSPSFLQDFTNPEERTSQPAGSPHPMSLSTIVDFDTSQPESSLSEDKRRSLIDMIVAKFDEEDHCPGVKQKPDFLAGDQSRSTHVLSLGMIQTYLASYWSHFHPQVPILHKPTFDAEQCPNLLLVAMMALGASCLERIHGHEVTQACAELASFLAWHLRWALFKHPDFRPPAKLWMFQSLLLLEFYEKIRSVVDGSLFTAPSSLPSISAFGHLVVHLGRQRGNAPRRSRCICHGYDSLHHVWPRGRHGRARNATAAPLR